MFEMIIFFLAIIGLCTIINDLLELWEKRREKKMKDLRDYKCEKRREKKMKDLRDYKCGKRIKEYQKLKLKYIKESMKYHLISEDNFEVSFDIGYIEFSEKFDKLIEEYIEIRDLIIEEEVEEEVEDGKKPDWL